MKAKDTTESQGTVPKENQSHLRREVLKLTHNLDEKKRKRERRDNIFNGIWLGFIGLVTIFSIATGNWLAVLFNLTQVMWILMLWVKDKHISLLRHTLDMTFGLRDLENKELEALMAADAAKKGKK